MDSGDGRRRDLGGGGASAVAEVEAEVGMVSFSVNLTNQLRFERMYAMALSLFWLVNWVDEYCRIYDGLPVTAQH
jgi:hypothetical protein